MKKLREVMSSPVYSVNQNDTIQKSAQIMAEHDIGSICVMENNQLVGILTERDFTKKVVASNGVASDLLVKDLMERKVVTASPDETLFEAANTLAKSAFRRLPIMEEGKVVGIVTETDVQMAMREQSIDELKSKKKELEIFNKMAIGRELRMVELKKRIEELEGGEK